MILFGYWGLVSSLPGPAPAPMTPLVQPLRSGARVGLGGEVLLVTADGAVFAGQMGAPQLGVQLGGQGFEARLLVTRLPYGPGGDVALAYNGLGGESTRLALGAGLGIQQGTNAYFTNDGFGLSPYGELRGAHQTEAGFSVPFSVRAGAHLVPEQAVRAPFAELSVGAAWQSDSCWEVGIGLVGSTTVEAGDLRAQAGLSCRLDQLAD